MWISSFKCNNSAVKWFHWWIHQCQISPACQRGLHLCFFTWYVGAALLGAGLSFLRRLLLHVLLWRCRALHRLLCHLTHTCFLPGSDLLILAGGTHTLASLDAWSSFPSQRSHTQPLWLSWRFNDHSKAVSANDYDLRLSFINTQLLYFHILHHFHKIYSFSCVPMRSWQTDQKFGIFASFVHKDTHTHKQRNIRPNSCTTSWNLIQ